MDIRQLELFLAVMDSSSVTRAAEKSFGSATPYSLYVIDVTDALVVVSSVRQKSLREAVGIR